MFPKGVELTLNTYEISAVEFQSWVYPLSLHYAVSTSAVFNKAVSTYADFDLFTLLWVNSALIESLDEPRPFKFLQ